MDMSTIRARVRAFLNEPTADYWTDAEILGWINDGYHLVEAETEYTENIKTDSTVKKQQEYSFPTDCIVPNVVYWEDDPLPQGNWDKRLRLEGSQNMNDYGDPEGYIPWNKKVYLYPTPDTASSEATIGTALTAAATSIIVDATTGFPAFGKVKVDSEVVAYTNKTATKFAGCSRAQEGSTATSHATQSTVYERDITIVYYGTSADLSATTDTPNIPSQYHVLLAYYAASMALFKSKSLPEAKEFERLFRIGLKEMRHKIRTNRHTIYPPVKDAGSYGYERP